MHLRKCVALGNKIPMLLGIVGKSIRAYGVAQNTNLILEYVEASQAQSYWGDGLKKCVCGDEFTAKPLSSSW